MRLKFAFPTIFAAALGLSLTAPAAFANPAEVAPAGWERSEGRGLVIYKSPSSIEALAFRVPANATDPASAVAEAAATLTNRAERVIVSAPSTQGAVSVHDIEYFNRNVTMVGKVIGVRQANGALLTVVHLGQKSEPGIAARMETSVERMATLAGGGDASGAQAARPPSSARSGPQPRPAAKAAPTGTKHGQSVSAVLFDLSYSYGVGGAFFPTYDLVVLLGNGQAARLGGYSVEQVDIAAIRRQEPGHVGTWQKAGANYRVRWGDGDTSDLKTTVGPPRALPGKAQLVGRYQAIGGGGNVAMGGGTITAQVKEITFRRDGTFSQSSKKSASSGAGVGRAGSGTSGRWDLSGSTLILSYGNGQVVRTSVFYSGSRKASAKFGRYGVLWIGGDDYKRVR